MKRAYQSAVENAFSHLLLVVLENGKVFVTVNSAIDEDASSHSHISPTDDEYRSQIIPVTHEFTYQHAIANAIVHICTQICRRGVGTIDYEVSNLAQFCNIGHQQPINCWS